MRDAAPHMYRALKALVAWIESEEPNSPPYLEQIQEQVEAALAMAEGRATGGGGLLTVDEAARQLTVKPGTIRSWILHRRIEFVRIGRSVRIPQLVVNRLIAAGRTEATHG